MNKKVVFSIIAITVVFVIVLVVFFSQKPQIQSDNDEQVSEVIEEPRFSRPEEIGEDFSLFETSKVINYLAESTDKVERRKAAKVIGDRDLAGTLNLTNKQKEVIEKIVEEYLQQSKSEDSNMQSEARRQIEYLWKTAVPALLKNIDNENLQISDMATDRLVLMRNEHIIKEIINVWETTKNPKTKDFLALVLKNMKYPSYPLLSCRESINQEDCNKLYKELIEPILPEIDGSVKKNETEVNNDLIELLEKY